MHIPARSLATLCLIALLPTPGVAAEDPPLVKIDVVNGWTAPDGAQVAGLRLRVATGWKTYWRSPGDTGIPPHFDWSGSQNLRAVRIHWPRPHVADLNGEQAFVYTGEVVLPVDLIPEDPAKPVVVSGRADLGVCSDICVPVSQTYAAAGTDGTAAIRASLGAQPARDTIEAAQCAVTPIADGLRVTATLRLPDQGGPEAAVFELPGGDVWVSPAVTSRKGRNLTAEADLVPPAAAPFALDRSQLRITVLGRDGAAETVGCPAG